MHEQVELVLSYVRGAWRFRWYGLAAAWLLAIAGWTFSLNVPDEYESSAQVHVDTASMLKPLMRGMVIESNVERRVELMTRTLLSRPNLEEIARQTDMDLNASTPAQFDRIVDRLERNLRLAGTTRDNLYRIKYQGKDPRHARDVVQATVNLLVEESMGRSRQDSASATRFLERKIEEYKAQVDAAEQRLIEFRRAHAAELSGGGDYYSRLQERAARLEEARFQLELAQSRVKELERQLGGEEPVFGIMPGEGEYGSGQATPELDQKIATLEEELDQLLLKYTENHPRVDTLRLRLERFRKERDEQREQLAATQGDQPSSGQTDVSRNPVYQEIRAALAQARAEAAAARTRVEQYSRQVAELRARVDSAPEVEAEHENLQRQFREAKQTYDQLAERRKTAEISAEVERSEDQVEFRVVEPPRVPSEPAAPNRPLLVTASLGAAAAGYGALGLLLSLIWPTFYTRAALHEALQLPVVGAIEQVHTARARKRLLIELALYVIAIGILLLAYGVVMAIALEYL